jgi:GT2 family glycosyltransferase
MHREHAKAKEAIEAQCPAPSRKFAAALQRISTLAHAAWLTFQAARRQIRARGGVIQSVAAGVSILRQEGVGGVKRRFNWLYESDGYHEILDDAYGKWIVLHDTLTPAIQAEIDQRLRGFARKPLFSLVVPTYNSNPHYLREMIRSVRDQIYSNWELCIADDASTFAGVREILEEEAAGDARLKVCFRSENGHISEASNSALSLATGEFIVLLDHDDVLPRHALFMVAQYVNWHPHARMLYSDEDKLTPDGKRTAPYFKCDWNPELFLSQNMFSHLGVYEAALIREAGGFRKGFEGSQDHDLALRCAALAGHDQIVHIPHVLYHWRAAPGSTAANKSEKPYAIEAAIRATAEHLARCQVKATVGQSFGKLRVPHVQYEIPVPAPMVSLLIPTRDGADLLKQCIHSVISKTSYRNYEIIVIDNGSKLPETLDYFESIKQYPNVRVLRDDSPFNFSALNNFAAARAKGDVLCLLNNDIEVISPGWLDEMVGLALQRDNGVVGAALWYPDNKLQHGGVLMGLGGIAGHMHRLMLRGHAGYFGRGMATQNVSAVTAACLVIRKAIYDELGGLDEELAVAFNDVDFCLRVREAGYRNVWTPHAELYHHESASRGSDMAPEKFERFARETQLIKKRWADIIERDPAYNPNLSLNAHQPFSLASPPRKGMLD